MGKARTLMIQGTGSFVGKSILAAALGRIFLQDGHRVAPFKAQNMALNSFVTRAGDEMGRAQAVQARACRLEPEVRMNPVLIKPTADTKAQVIVMGKPYAEMSAGDYHERKRELSARVTAALDGLRSEYELVVIEGAGSPAEINLRDSDIVNMAVAVEAGAPVLLVGDIDRGGVFAALHGTLELLTPREREHIKGLLINKFRGDRALLAPGIAMIEVKTDRPVLGVIPYYRDIVIPEEDSVRLDEPGQRPARGGEAIVIEVPRLDHISNFTDFDPLEQEPDVVLRYVRPDEKPGPADLIILPGTKNTIGDYLALERHGYLDRVRAQLDAGRPVFGICGGYQMLGKRILNPEGIEDAAASVTTLGLLDLVTEFKPEKTLRQVTARHRPTGLAVTGYEIHMGVSSFGERDEPLFAADGRVLGTAARTAPVSGTYIHGVFDDDAFRRHFINGLRARRGLAPAGEILYSFDGDREFDKLADLVRANLDLKKIYRIIEAGV